MGVILGIASKHNEADALDVFERREHMVLKKRDFVATMVNWSAKAQNIAEIAQDLVIGMDSIVFIDDNPVERESIRTALPEITVAEFPLDTSELASFFEQVHKEFFFTLEFYGGGSQTHAGISGQRRAHRGHLGRKVSSRVTHQDIFDSRATKTSRAPRSSRRRRTNST